MNTNPKAKKKTENENGQFVNETIVKGYEVRITFCHFILKFLFEKEIEQCKRNHKENETNHNLERTCVEQRFVLITLYQANRESPSSTHGLPRVHCVLDAFLPVLRTASAQGPIISLQDKYVTVQ